MPFNIKKYNEINDLIKKTLNNAKKRTKIVAISKYHTEQSVLEAIEAGVEIFGENRVQEAITKFSNLKKINNNLQLHLTGPLQTNKVKQALTIFDVFQTLDREKLANEFFKFKDICKNKYFFIQVNIGKESNKSGVYPEIANEFIEYCMGDLSLPIIGLMCIPPIKDDPEPHFRNLKKIAKQNNLIHLSMGMSSDYEKAILIGATYIRIGTALFGNRNEK